MKVFYPRASREEIIRALEAGATRLAAQVPLVEVVLFGSVASGRQTVASDVDVLVVYKGSRRDDVFALAKQLIGLRGVEPHVYSETEAALLQEPLARMTRDGVRIYPITAADRGRA